MRRQLGLLRKQRDIRVDQRKALASHHTQYFGQHLAASDTFILRIAVRKVSANIAVSHRAK